MQWQDIATAPFDRELELAVIDREGSMLSPSRAVVSPVGGLMLKPSTRLR
jgi:hypothetical protein